FDTLATCSCRRTLSAVSTPERAEDRKSAANYTVYGDWTWVASPKLLVNAGYQYRFEHIIYEYPRQAPDGIGVTETATGVMFRAQPGALHNIPSHPVRIKGSVAYVTGSHNVKVGAQWFSSDLIWEYNEGLTYSLLNGVPASVTYSAFRHAEQNVKAN